MNSKIMFALEETAREHSFNYECDFVNYMIDVMFVNSVVANSQSERTKEVLTQRLLDKYRSKPNMNKNRKGQALVEYALILALVSCACFYAFSNLGQQLRVTYLHIANSLQQANELTQQQQVIPPQPPTPPTPPQLHCIRYNKHGKCKAYGY